MKSCSSFTSIQTTTNPPYCARHTTLKHGREKAQRISHTDFSLLLRRNQSLSRDEEIALLEEQLRKLRQEENTQQPSQDTDLESMSEEEQKISQRLEKMKGKDMLLSERELIGGGILDNDTDGAHEQGNSVLKIVGALVGISLLVAVAQIPVGQESLSQYSATGSSAVKTIDLGDLNPDIPKT